MEEELKQENQEQENLQEEYEQYQQAHQPNTPPQSKDFKKDYVDEMEKLMQQAKEIASFSKDISDTQELFLQTNYHLNQIRLIKSFLRRKTAEFESRISALEEATKEKTKPLKKKKTKELTDKKSK